jgi:hypothetical protein
LSITLIVLYFALDGGGEIEKRIQGLEGAFSSPPAILDAYGLRTLVPIAVAIFLLGIAQANSNLMRIVGAAVPGRLVPDRRHLFLKYAPPKDIVKAWAHAPKVASVEDLSDVIDETIIRPSSKEIAESLWEGRSLQRVSEFLVSTGDFVKGLVVATILVVSLSSLIDGRPVNASHLAVLLAILSVAILYLTILRIRAERDYASVKARSYNLYRSYDEAPTVAGPSRFQNVYDAAKHGRNSPLWTLNFAPAGVVEDLRTLYSAISPRPIWERLGRR